MTLAQSRSIEVAVYKSPGVVELETREISKPGASEVVVEIAYCGVCGSDLHLIVEGWGTPEDVLGHEWTGVVLETGETSDLSVGDHVAGTVEQRCGACNACLSGDAAQCENQGPVTGQFDGAFATHMLAADETLRRIPAGLDLRTAALAEPLAVALHAIRTAELAPTRSVLVSGAGPIGTLAAAALLVDGHNVSVVEPSPSRRIVASRIGVNTVLHPDDLQTFDISQVDSLATPAYDAVIETSGKAVAMETGIQQLNRGGRMVIVGTGLDNPTFDTNRQIVLELSVVGSFTYDHDGFEQALGLLAGDSFDADLLIDSNEVGLDGVGEVARGLAAGEIAGKALIKPSRG